MNNKDKPIAAIQERITTLEYLHRGCKNRIRCIRTNMQGSAFIDRMVKYHTEAIARHQRDLADLIHTVEHGPELIDGLEKRVKELQKAIALVKNQRAIEQIIELQRKINAATQEGTER